VPAGIVALVIDVVLRVTLTVALGALAEDGIYPNVFA
jgi:hypothetical protein